MEVWVYGDKTIFLRTQQILGITKRSNAKTNSLNLAGLRWFSVCCCWCCYVSVVLLLKVCFVMMSYTQYSSNFNHAIFVLTHCMQEIVARLHKRGVFGSMHTAVAMRNQKSVCLCLFFYVWGRVIIVLVNEGISINTPKASFSVSTSNQPSDEQLREREREQ